jgi:hypothetical protein
LLADPREQSTTSGVDRKGEPKRESLPREHVGILGQLHQENLNGNFDRGRFLAACNVKWIGR